MRSRLGAWCTCTAEKEGDVRAAVTAVQGRAHEVSSEAT